MRRLPKGLLPFGDSLCSFNPVYGQGMTVAALQALVLQRHLQHAGALPTRRMLRDFAGVVDAPWEMARGADLALPGVPGHRSWMQRLMGSYVERLHAAAEHDATLATAFVRVSGLVDSPAALLHPRVALRVLRATRTSAHALGPSSGGTSRSCRPRA